MFEKAKEVMAQIDYDSFKEMEELDEWEDNVSFNFLYQGLMEAYIKGYEEASGG